MIALILLTIVLAVAIGGLIHLHHTANHVMPRDIPLLKETPEEHKKRMDDMIARWKKEGEEAKKEYEERRIFLNSTETLTNEEKEEREIVNAKHLHDVEHVAIRKAELSHYDIVDIYSPELRRKAQEFREANKERSEKVVREMMEKCTDDEARASLQDLIDHPPSDLGLKLTSKNPNFRRWDMEAEARATAYVGTIFEWMTCEVMGEPLQEKGFYLIRTSGKKRWIYLTLTREKTESAKEILAEYLHAMSPLEIVKKPDASISWIIWNAAKNSWI
jgi:polyhydroxyalkanoate synthesis regulator phasin